MITQERSPLRRVSKRHPCPVCEKPDWCSVSANGEMAICMRRRSPYQTKNGGYVHRLAEPVPVLEPIQRERQRAPVDWAEEQETCMSRVTEEPLQLFAVSLGVSADSLRRLGVGLTQDRRAWTFPWYDAGGCVVGIQCQGAARRKWCVKGSRMELFLPSDNDGGRWLLICEGASDTASLLDRGFDAIGRASRAQGMEEACAYALDRDCVVVTDTDPEGIQDSSRFARMLKRTASSVRIVKPVCGAKDARAFGRSRAAWLTLIGNARPI